MRKNNQVEKGRTLLETIMVIVIMVVISIGVYKFFHMATDKATAQKLEQDINLRVAQLRHQAMTQTGIRVEAQAKIMKASGYPLRICAADKVGSKTFTLCVGDADEPLKFELCKHLVERPTFNPDNEDTACNSNQIQSEFVFPMFADLKNFESGKYNPTRQQN